MNYSIVSAYYFQGLITFLYQNLITTKYQFEVIDPQGNIFMGTGEYNTLESAKAESKLYNIIEHQS